MTGVAEASNFTDAFLFAVQRSRRRRFLVHVVGFGRTSSVYRDFAHTPSPAADLGHVLTVLRNVLLVLDEPVADCLLGIGGLRTEFGDAVDDVLDEMKPVEVV